VAVKRTGDFVLRDHEPLSNRNPNDPAGTPLERFTAPDECTGLPIACPLVEVVASA
jgi:hypothetical protein